MQREHFGSRLGFILLSAGCAIGIGNVWKFPYITGQNGGAIFVLIYLACLVLLGLPIMSMEFAMGRAAQKSPVKMYQELEPKGSKWHIHGYVAMAGNIILLMCYCTIAGWLLQYFVDTAAGKFTGLDSAAIANYFGSVTQNDKSMAFYTILTVALATVVCSFSLQGGLERITKWMMLALLSIMVLLAVNSCLLPGAAEGLKFYLLPSMERVGEAGFGTKDTPETNVRTIWDGSDIWIRRDVEIAAEDIEDVTQLVGYGYHDEDCEIYVNGVEVAKCAGYASYGYIGLDAVALKKALKAGKNTIAIHCHQTKGGQYIDFGILREIPKTK